LFTGFRFGRFGVEEGVANEEVTVFEDFVLDVVDFDLVACFGRFVDEGSGVEGSGAGRSGVEGSGAGRSGVEGSGAEGFGVEGKFDENDYT
jgi:hypothetical protein